MNNMPLALRRECEADPFYKVCARIHEGGCSGKITFEHAITFAAKQVQAKWAVIPLCEHHHAANLYQESGSLNKEINRCIALNRASESELRAISKADNYLAVRDRLNIKYPFIKENLAKPLPTAQPNLTTPKKPDELAYPQGYRIEGISTDQVARNKIMYAIRLLGEAYILNGDSTVKDIRDCLEQYLTFTNKQKV